MSTLIYQIEFFDYWHVGTGLVSGANSDALVQKDLLGLPFIPGKTLKGLLREAAENLQSLGHAKVSDNFIKEVFGERNLDNEETSGTNRVEKEAKSFFGNATLSARLQQEIKKDKEDKKDKAKFFYKQIASTAIEKNGQAKDYSLRSVEVTIPLVLYASISNFDASHQEAMNACLKWVKRIGLNRNRGLGRCQFTPYSIEDKNQNR